MIARMTRSASHGDLEPQAEYEQARLPREMTTAITWYMKEHGITKRELAERLHVTPGRVSQILSGDENLTLRTLAVVSAALGAHFRVELDENHPSEVEQPSESDSERIFSK